MTDPWFSGLRLRVRWLGTRRIGLWPPKYQGRRSWLALDVGRLRLIVKQPPRRAPNSHPEPK